MKELNQEDLAALEKRTEITLEIYNLLNSLSSDLSRKEAERRISKKWAEIRNRFGPQILKRASKPPKQIRYRRQNKNYEADAYFLSVLEGLERDYLKKCRQVEKLKRKEPEVVSDKINKHFRNNSEVPKVKPDEIDKIRLDFLQVIVVLEDYKLNQLRPDKDKINGLSLHNSPINLISDSVIVTSRGEKTIAHEAVHTFLDGSDYHTATGSPYFEETAEKLNEFKKQKRKGRPESLVKKAADKARAALEKEIKVEINNRHEEILAELRFAEEKGFGLNTYGRADKESGQRNLSSSSDFNNIMNVLSTAGRNSKELIEWLEEKQEDNLLSELKKDLKRAERITKHELTETFKKLNTQFKIARYIGGDAYNFTYCACILLKPVQFHYLEDLLQYRYEKEYKRARKKLRTIKKRKEVWKGFSFKVNKLPTWCRRWNLDKLDIIQQEELRKKLNDYNFDEMWRRKEHLFKFPNFKEYKNHILSLAKKTELDPVRRKEIKENITYRFFECLVRYNALEAPDSDLPKRSELNSVEFEQLIKVTEKYIEKQMISDIESRSNRPIRWYHVRRNKIWKFMKHYNLTQREELIGLIEKKIEQTK